MGKSILVGKKPTNYEVEILDKPISKNKLSSAIKSYNKILIVTDDGLPKKYLAEIKKLIPKSKKVYIYSLPAGEKSKSLKSFNLILENLASLKFDRTDCLIALGGGMVGDITGFVASSYLRGIDFIQIPTTLLSQVDSSVGGKTAINISQGKNLVGAFYNPKKVFISLSYLQTLSEKEYRSGLGEVVKYAFILNKRLHRILKSNSNLVLSRNLKVLEEVIYESIKTKSKIVTKDEKENGVRALLNFGHTFGHAIEAKNNYKGVSHGEAVVLGMIIASEISYLENYITKKELEEIKNLITSLGL
ncbi:3-dehydroquinate synthase, partial [Gammaproteobacteria bacterium]|nr:3-dehydroquinate synthase [Gammaproteobacteria bacterium]